MSFNFYRRFLLLSFVLCFYFNNCFACNSLEVLRHTFNIENNILTTASGQKFSHHPFEDELHFNLAFYMKDLRSAEIVYKSYKNTILPLFERIDEVNAAKNAKEVFSKALIEICLLFGHSTVSPEKSFFYSLTHQGSEGLRQGNCMKKLIDA